MNPGLKSIGERFSEASWRFVDTICYKFMTSHVLLIRITIKTHISMSTFTALGGNNKSVPINCGSLYINYTVSCVLTSLIAVGPCQFWTPGVRWSCIMLRKHGKCWRMASDPMKVHSVEFCGHRTLSKPILFLPRVKGAKHRLIKHHKQRKPQK